MQRSRRLHHCSLLYSEGSSLLGSSALCSLGLPLGWSVRMGTEEGEKRKKVKRVRWEKCVSKICIHIYRYILYMYTKEYCMQYSTVRTVLYHYTIIYICNSRWHHVK